MRPRPQHYVRQASHFVRDYTAGLKVRDLRRLFDQDASQAYRVLGRDHDLGPEPAGGPRRLLYRARVLFLGLSYKLSPSRRLLFAASLILAVVGLVNRPHFSFTSDQARIYIDFSPLLFLASIGCLVWLLIVELVDRVRVRDELEVARQLQHDLLPDRSPNLDGYQFAHSYRTANEVGGDYYDFQQLPDGRLAIVIGDASGHGIAAGLLMAIANATLKTALDIDPEPEAVAKLLNGTLCRTGDRRAFMTLFYGVLDPPSGQLDYVCAGHPFPILRRAGGELAELGEGTLPLGMRRRLEPSRGRVTLQPGDLLLLFTDGLPEAVDAPEGTAFGFQRLRELLAHPGSSAAVHDRVLLAFDEHVGREPLTDDLTLVVVARTG